MRTVGEYIDSLKHALGKSPAPGHDLYTTLNAAGVKLVSEHAWEWRTEGPISVPVVGGQDWVDLPKNFGNVLDCWLPNTGIFTLLEIVDRAIIGQMRAIASVTVTAGVLKICFNANRNTPHSPTLPIALLYPKPLTDGVPTFQLIYDRRWVPVSAKDDDSPVSIPEDFEHALDLFARSTACMIENQAPTIETSMLQDELKRLKNEDGLRQPTEGFVRGGVNSRLAFARRARKLDTTWGLADLNR